MRPVNFRAAMMLAGWMAVFGGFESVSGQDPANSNSPAANPPPAVNQSTVGNKPAPSAACTIAPLPPVQSSPPRPNSGTQANAQVAVTSASTTSEQTTDDGQNASTAAFSFETFEPLPPTTSGEIDARLRALELRLEEQRVITEDLQDQLQQAQAPPPAPAAQPQPSRYRVGSILELQPVWNYGLEFNSPNRDFWMHFGGRTQLDAVGLSSPNPTAALTNTQQSPNVGLADAVDVRRARLRAEGSMLELYDWCVEYNFVNSVLVQSPSASAPSLPNGNYPNSGTSIRTLQSQVVNTPSPTDLWWNFKKLPFLGNITIGNIKEPFSVERLQSSRYLDFLERNYGQDAFISPSANGFAPGILNWNWTRDKRTTYAVGFFKNVTNAYVFNVGNGEDEISGRITHAFIYDEPTNGRYLLHVGVGATQRGIDNGQIRYRARGMLWNSPNGALDPIWADTNYINGSCQDMVVPELIGQYGSLFVQAEFQANWTTHATTNPGTFQGGPPSGANVGDLYFYSYYVTVGYFLTGEHKIYDYQKGVVGRIIPNSNAFFTRGTNGLAWGPGAWQVVGRFQQLDLDDKLVSGGKLTDFTFGINWFLNPNMKVQFNYDAMWRQAGGVALGGGTKSLIDGIGWRFAADF